MAFTFFFRDQPVLERAADQFVSATAGRNRPRIWDAGSATGQEPYSLSILLAERMGHFAFNNLRIDATDVESAGSFGKIVSAAVYPGDELARLPGGVLEKYFEPDEKPGHWRVAGRIRAGVTYRQHDLLSLREPGRGYSLVVCKNVLLHFQPGDRVQVLRMFHRALAPEGLFATEHTQEMPAEVAPLFRRVSADVPLFSKLEDAA